MLSGLQGCDLEYPELIAKMVCDPSSKDCMLHRCNNCPEKEAVQQYLEEKIQEHYDEDDEVTFKQWQHTDRTTLIKQQMTVDDYIQDLCDKINALTTHDYIAKHQSTYLRNLKANLSHDTALVILDFTENYSFVLQDSAQGFYWDNSQATIHPFSVYYITEENDIKTLSLACISDCLKHDTVTVYAFQNVVINLLKERSQLSEK